jgi:hypothetical protein
MKSPPAISALANSRSAGWLCVGLISAQRHQPQPQHQVAHHLGVSAHLDMAGTKFVLASRVAAWISSRITVLQ